LTIIAGEPHHLAVQIRDLLLDSRTRAAQRYYRSREFRPVLCQLRSADGKCVHLCSANNETKVLEETRGGKVLPKVKPPAMRR
jgi:hypothetical protein